ncbi:DinB family protein [Streptomyces sp. ID05-04B]|uniref:DinB family protein n=1 Tax=Streptomyces sp. ID05-04B TaxID=3028661 RepID=UPI0029C17F4B|nr:DinB family protein [Streptomyces sp. ID05-04B]MDX5563920.1 DinB family protein [Streptomyces sp. ID05-04B]
MDERSPLDRQAVSAELERVRADFRHLLTRSSITNLRGPTAETRWTNEQLLFHMLFGYMLIRVLLRLLGVFARLPRAVGRTFARLLNAAARPFHVINYVSSVAGALFYNHRRMGAKMDSTLAALQRRLDQDSDASLARGMPFPPRWDPFFHDWMTRADLYRYPTQHYDFHRTQLTLGPARD